MADSSTNLLSPKAPGATAVAVPDFPIPAMILAVFIWAIVVVGTIVVHGGQVFEGRLEGNDSYVRMVQVREFLAGAEWHDLTMERLNPPDGVDMHWSRLVDLPYAAVIAAAAPLLGAEDAEAVAVTAVPLLLLLVFLIGLAAVTAPVGGTALSIPTVMLGVLAFYALAQFLPGRIDHHGIQALLMIWALAGVVRIAVGRERSQWPTLAGVAGGLSLWVGGEAIPWIVAVNAALAVMWMSTGRGATGAVRFGAGLAATTAAALVLALPVSDWLVVACDGLSIFHLCMSAAVLAFWVLLHTLQGQLPTIVSSPWVRVGSAGIGAAAIGGGLVVIGGNCLLGPYGDLDPRLVDAWLSNVSEAQNIFAFFGQQPGQAVVAAYLPVVGLLTLAFVMVRDRRTATVWAWFMVGACLMVQILLMAWQVRAATASSALAAIAAAPLLAAIWAATEPWRRAPPRVLVRLATVFILSPGPALVANTLVAPGSGVAATNASAEAEQVCNVAETVGLLADDAIVAAEIDLGPDLLYHTRYGVLSAPYHRNGTGILAAYDIIRSSDLDAAYSVAQARGVSAVIACTVGYEADLAGLDGHEDTLMARLLAGNPPDWLVPVPVLGSDAMLVFQVVDAAR